MRHQYGISVVESQTFLRAKRPHRRRARRNGCFRRLSHGATSRNYIAQLVLKKEISKQLSKRIFRQSLYNFLVQLSEAIMSTNNSREILACRLQVLSREQRGGERQRARVNMRRASEDDRQRERVRSRRRRQPFSEESRQVERVRARSKKERKV